MNLNKQIQKKTMDAFKSVFPNYIKFFSKKNIIIKSTKKDNFGDYQCDYSMRIAKKIKLNPLNISQKVLKYLQNDKIFYKIEIKKPGFINFFLSKLYIEYLCYKLIKEKNLFMQFPSSHVSILGLVSPVQKSSEFKLFSILKKM